MISEPVVLSLLSHLDVRKSVGPDGLSTRFLKEVVDKNAGTDEKQNITCTKYWPYGHLLGIGSIADN